MFKTKEELIEELATDDTNKLNERQKEAIILINHGIKNGIIHSFNFFAERVEFYKKWSMFGAEPWRIRNENEELYDKWKAYDHKNNWTNGSDRVYDTHYYHQWLFDYCFGDIK